ncbi:25505_t:CDS:2, partial [Gigaspora rosea]
VSNDLICAARKHSHIYDPEGLVTEKPIIRYEKYILWSKFHEEYPDGMRHLTLLIQKHVAEHTIQ